MQNLSPKKRRWARARVAVLGVLLACFALAVGRRAYELQIERAPALREMAEQQYLRDVRLAPKRGTIYDRHGAELAVSVDVDSVWANPRELRANDGDPAIAAGRLSRLLGVNEERIRTRLESDRYFVWIKRRVSPQLAARLRALEIPGVHMDREARRFYPGGSLASHVLGFANIDGQGIEGVELSFEDALRGTARSAPAIRDRRGRVVFSETLFDDQAAEGADLTLTLDKTLQHVAEQELALAVQTFEARSGSVVVMDPSTGELLAVANFPTYDPNSPGDSPVSHRRNRAVTDRFEPGSTVKPFTVAAALAAGTIGSEQRIDCLNGEMEVAEYTIHDTSRHGLLTPAQILAFSSNIGTAKIGETLGRRGLYRAFRSFGFGESTGLPLPGEANGLLRDYRRWYEMDAATISFGQGVSVTGIQLATAMSVIANGGRLVQPRLLSAMRRGESVEEIMPQTRRRVVPTRVARLVADMLTAVTGPGGTAPEAAIDGYLVAGKTGTAQKADSVTGGYAEDRWIASFVGFVPAQNPRLVISVVIDEPVVSHYGGEVAGPVFRRIGEVGMRHLGVPAEGGGEALVAHSREQRRRRNVVRRAEVQARRDARRAAREGGEPADAEDAEDVDADAVELLLAADEVRVPDLEGMQAREAITTLGALGLRAQFIGSGSARGQEPPAGAGLEAGGTVRVVLRLDSSPSAALPPVGPTVAVAEAPAGARAQ